ncbi:CRISPR-associated protein Cas4 [Candidatus Synechococcus spongiarum LMB bulk15M]|uniref:CRISPR-associated exonuclease Cas4 n=1 Tax=Candidatus Synechococcus spongiarum LMB bulk15M TaxID=1943582 RepID=A0A1T1D3N4_9SYNE|nr:CRISPR-associated protein Cas4 [Candidatus Synechococcus spongiarum LMB bulk15M]
MSVELVVPISAIEHFAYCPRQCALIHCDGVWSDNEHTVRGTRAHRRVDSGKHRRERGQLVLRGIPLWSEVLGLSGRADAVEIAEDDAIRPVEYKAGVRHGPTADLQLCAQALCLEEMLKAEIPYGYVWYGGPRRRLRVDFTTALRNEVCGIVEEIREQLLSGQLPAAVDDERCSACQLLHHCLPQLANAPRKVRSYLKDVVFGCAT